LNERELAELFNTTLASVEGRTPSASNAVVNVRKDPVKSFAFMEFATPEDADIAMCMTGVLLKGQQLKIKRPTNYEEFDEFVNHKPKQWKIAGLNTVQNTPGYVARQVPDGPNKVFLGGLPSALTTEQVKMLVGVFGDLQGFALKMDTVTGMNKGYCFFAFRDPSKTGPAIAGLHGMDIAGNIVTCKIANTGAKNTGDDRHGQTHAQRSGAYNVNPTGNRGGYVDPLAAASVAAAAPLRGHRNNNNNNNNRQHGHAIREDAPITHVVELLNMVTEAELNDDEEYQDILLDVQQEMEQYGTVKQVFIPRPRKPQEHKLDPNIHPSRQRIVKQPTLAELNVDVGKVFVWYSTPEFAAAGYRGVEGRKFGEIPIKATLISEQVFRTKLY
jgi:splicing factor U2AF subunit